jgi:hypothetical protein
MGRPGTWRAQIRRSMRDVGQCAVIWNRWSGICLISGQPAWVRCCPVGRYEGLVPVPVLAVAGGLLTWAQRYIAGEVRD